MNILIESVTRIETPRFVVRVWRQEEKIGHRWPLENTDLKGIAQTASDVGNHALKLVQDLLTLPRVNAVEVLDHEGNGVVYCKNWP